MADMLIYWDEINEGLFPDCCMTCGCEGTDLVPRYLEVRPWFGIIGMLLRRTMTVALPDLLLSAALVATTVYVPAAAGAV